MIGCVLFFKQKTAYDMRISDWSSDVCSSDLAAAGGCGRRGGRPSGRCRFAAAAGCRGGWRAGGIGSSRDLVRGYRFRRHRAVGGRHAPHRITGIVGDEKSAGAVYADPDRTAAGLIAVQEAGHAILPRAGPPAVFGGPTTHPVAVAMIPRPAPLPAPS